MVFSCDSVWKFDLERHLLQLPSYKLTRRRITKLSKIVESRVNRRTDRETMKMKLFLHFQALLSFNLLLCLVSSAVLVGAADRALVSQFIGPQNKARAEVGVPPLVWDEKVARYAEAYANQRKGDCALQHSNGPYGENIFWGSSGADWQPQDANSGWIGEKRFFNYATRTCDQFEKCGHYTQVVWKNSAKIGCAKVICDDGGTFITCNYDPPGNFIGEKPY